ncbi:acetyl-CoA carboxylase biotin carboxyl carrier protein [Magnetovibrio sp. PR-2]|uniref:acetyl-CoA carboxylase biotin carboxyl carrier protein n=1 Tax=Magnetovibrio sp. PR-2 TaxID=3120356 RepID=UPI002FCE19ED
MSKKIDVDDDLIRKLADIMDDTGLTEIEIGQADFTVRVSRGSTAVAAMAPAAAPAAAAPGAAEDAISPADHPGVVTSPMVGVAYTAPEPGAAQFINVGDTVSEGQVVMLVEAMKVFNQIKAPKSGTVKSIMVESGSPVEFGEPLLIIE